MGRLQLKKPEITPKQVSYLLVFLIIGVCVGYYLYLALTDVPIMDNWVVLAAYAEKVITGDLTLQDWFGGNATGHHSLDAIPMIYFMVVVLKYNTVAINLLGFALSFVCFFVLLRNYRKSVSNEQNIYVLPLFLLIGLQFFTLGKWEIVSQSTSLGFYLRLLTFLLCFTYISNLLSNKTFTARKVVVSCLIILYCVNFGGIGYSAAFLAAVVGAILVYWLVSFKQWNKRQYLCLGGIVLGCGVALATYLGAGLLASQVQSSDGVQPESLVTQLIALLTGGDLIPAMLYGLAGSVIHITTVEKLASAEILVFGCVILALTVVCLVLYFKKKLYQRTWLPLMFLIYGYVNILLMAMTRSGYPMYGTIASRYMFDTLLIPLSVVWILGLCIMDCEKKTRAGKGAMLAMLLPVVFLSVVTMQTNLTEMKLASSRKLYNQGLQQMVLAVDDYEDSELSAFQSDPKFVREGVRVMKKYKLSFIADEETVSRMYESYTTGIYNDGWVDKEMAIFVKTGANGEITLDLQYCPEFAVGKLKIFIDNDLAKEVALGEDANTATITLENLPENTYVKVKMQADFSFVNPPDIRELSFILRGIYGN